MGRRSATPRPRRTWGQRAVIGANSFLVVLCLGSAFALGYSARQIGHIARIPLEGALDEQTDRSQPLNFLLVGTDNDEGLADDDPVRRGRQGENLADTIMILRIDPRDSSAALLSVPRDLWVSIPGRRGKSKINASLAYGSPPGHPGVLIQTLKDNLDLEINHYLQVNLAAFKALVDAIDGVRLWFDAPARDKKTGLWVPEPGCQELDGNMALAFARSREYEESVRPGRWDTDPTADIGRLHRQRYFMKQAAKKAISRGARNPIELNSLIGVAQRHMKIDDNLTPQMMLDLAGQFNRFNPDDLQPDDLVVRNGVAGGQKVLFLEEEASQPVLARFRDEPPPEPPSGDLGTDGGEGTDPAGTPELAAPAAGGGEPGDGTGGGTDGGDDGEPAGETDAEAVAGEPGDPPPPNFVPDPPPGADC